MKRLLFATGNSSKIYNMKRRLKGKDFQVISPKDIGISINVVEDGVRPGENAMKKAIAYYEKTKIPTIAADSALYIESLPKIKQPGLYVRRVNGKELTDEEMIEYYSGLIESIGGKSEAYYLTGLALINESGTYSIEIEEDHFIMISKRDKNHMHRGNPLDVITIDPSCGKYYSEITDEEVKSMGYDFDMKCTKFIEDNF